MYPDLEGKVAIVTGAGRRKGLGEAIARKLAADGVRLVIHDLGRTQGALAPAHGIGAVDELEAVAEDLRAIHPDIATFAADMRVEEEVKALVAHAVERFGRLDILVNNAGVGYLFGPLVDATQEMWDTVLNVNLRGAFFATKYAVRQMLTQRIQEGWGRGRIVSIGSRGSKSGSALTSSYIASKHGLVGLTRYPQLDVGAADIDYQNIDRHVGSPLKRLEDEFKVFGEAIASRGNDSNCERRATFGANSGKSRLWER